MSTHYLTEATWTQQRKEKLPMFASKRLISFVGRSAYCSRLLLNVIYRLLRDGSFTKVAFRRLGP